MHDKPGVTVCELTGDAATDAALMTDKLTSGYVLLGFYSANELSFVAFGQGYGSKY